MARQPIEKAFITGQFVDLGLSEAEAQRVLSQLEKADWWVGDDSEMTPVHSLVRHHGPARAMELLLSTPDLAPIRDRALAVDTTQGASSIGSLAADPLGRVRACRAWLSTQRAPLRRSGWPAVSDQLFWEADALQARLGVLLPDRPLLLLWSAKEHAAGPTAHCSGCEWEATDGAKSPGWLAPIHGDFGPRPSALRVFADLPFSAIRDHALGLRDALLEAVEQSLLQGASDIGTPVIEAMRGAAPRESWGPLVFLEGVSSAVVAESRLQPLVGGGLVLALLQVAAVMELASVENSSLHAARATRDALAEAFVARDLVEPATYLAAWGTGMQPLADAAADASSVAGRDVAARTAALTQQLVATFDATFDRLLVVVERVPADAQGPLAELHQATAGFARSHHELYGEWPTLPLEFPVAEQPTQDAFYPTGTAWFVRFEGKWSTFSHLVGLQHIWNLIHRAGDEVACEDLHALARTPPFEGQSTRTSSVGPMEGVIVEDALPSLEKGDIKGMRGQALRLRDQAERAREQGRDSRARDLEADADALEQHVRENSYRGKPRNLSRQPRNAANSVGGAIHVALVALEPRLPRLVEHLNDALQKGKLLKYRALRAPAWVVDGSVDPKGPV